MTHSRGGASLKSQPGSIQKQSSRITGKGSMNHYQTTQLPRVFSGSSKQTTGTGPKSASGAVQAASAQGSQKYGSKKKSSGAKGGTSGRLGGAGRAAMSNTALAGRPAASMSGQSAAAGLGAAAQGGYATQGSITYYPSQLTPELSKKLKKFLLTIKNGEQSIET